MEDILENKNLLRAIKTQKIHWYGHKINGWKYEY